MFPCKKTLYYDSFFSCLHRSFDEVYVRYLAYSIMELTREDFT